MVRRSCLRFSAPSPLLTSLHHRQSLIPVAAAQLFGLEGLATIVGFSVLVNSPGQMLGATLSGFVLSGSGGSYTAVACYSGGMMCGGSLLILYGESSPSALALVAETDPFSVHSSSLRQSTQVVCQVLKYLWERTTYQRSRSN